MVDLATSADVDDLTRLVAAFRDHMGKADPDDGQIRGTLSALLDDPDTEFLLTRDDGGRGVGFCQLRYRLSVWTGVDDCWLEDLFVAADARGGGHGRALVDAALERAEARGCKRVELDVNEDNEPALALYLSAGFTMEPKPPGRTHFISRRL